MALTIDPMQQLLQLLRVRWLVFRNGMRNKMKKTGLVWDILTYGIMAIAIIGTSVPFALAGYMAGKKSDFVVLQLMLWITFAVWQFIPVVMEGASPGLNFAEVARYPIPFKLYFLLASAYGLFDLAAIAGCVWLAVAWITILIFNPALALQFIPGLLLFVALNLYMNRWAFAWMERIVSTRKGRERMLVLFFSFSFLAQIFGNVIVPQIGGWIQANAKSLEWLIPTLKQIVPYLTWIFPPNLVVHGVRGPILSRLTALGIIALATCFCMWRYRRKLRLTYEGEIYSESNRSLVMTDRKPGWQLPFVSGKVSAVVQKEIIYVLGQPQMLYNMAVPLLLGALFVFKTKTATAVTVGLPSLFSGGVSTHMSLAYFCVFVLSQFTYNMLGMDSTGFARWMLAPMRLRDVMFAKNIAAGILMFTDFIIISIFVYFVRGFDAWGTPAVVVAFFDILFIVLGFSNIFSVFWPKKVEQFTLKKRPIHERAIFAGLLIQAVIVGFILLSGAVAAWKHAPWLMVVFALCGLPFTGFFYFLSLNFAERRVAKKSEELILELT